MKYRHQLAAPTEKDGKIKTVTFHRTDNHIEAQRRVYRNICYIEGKRKGGN